MVNGSVFLQGSVMYTSFWTALRQREREQLGAEQPSNGVDYWRGSRSSS